MQPIRCIGLEWELPLISRERLMMISPMDFASHFFAIRANHHSYLPKDERLILTQAFTRSLDMYFENGFLDPDRRHRRDLLESWKADPYWLMAGRRSGPPTPSTSSALGRYESSRKVDPPKGPANFNMGHVPDGPRGFADTHPPRDQAMIDYVIPPRDFLPLKDLTVLAFYDRFCNSNPEARKRKPWDVILSAYRDYVCKYYGNDLNHMEALKRSRLSYDEHLSGTLPKRVKVEPAVRSSESWGGSSAVGPGNRKSSSPIFVPEEESIPTGPSRLYSPSTPHLKVEWIHEQRGTEKDRRVVLPLKIAVKGTASKCQAANGSSAPIPRRSTDSSSHVQQAPPVTARTVVGSSDTSHDRVLQIPTWLTEVVAVIEHEKKEPASCSDIVVRKSVGDSKFGHDLLQSLILREKGSAAAEQPRIAEQNQTGSPVKDTTIDSNSTSRQLSSTAGNVGIPPTLSESAATSSALTPVTGPTTILGTPMVLSRISTTVETTSVQAPTDSIRFPLATVQENSKSLPKSITKHVVRLEAFLKGAAKELEASDEAITPQSIRLEALLHSAVSELKTLRSATDVKPAALEPKVGSRKSVTTHIMRLEAFLNEAVIEQDINGDEEITSQRIGLEAFLGSSVSELGIRKSALAA
ncbi:hypothetical protein MMC17_005931 [Xylographa soralifera]|nr:hypothetical protein [Xylographa soralifera]